MNKAGLVLAKLLHKPEQFIEYLPALKAELFKDSFYQLYLAINGFYDKFGKLPDFPNLTLYSKSAKVQEQLLITKDLAEQNEDINASVAVEALLDEFAQRFFLVEIDKILKDFDLTDAEDLKARLGQLLYTLEEKTHKAEVVTTIRDYKYNDETEFSRRVPLGINNEMDSIVGMFPVTNLVMFGGYRGSGKSLVCCNIVANLTEQGYITPYFSIEMRARECWNRILAIKAGISHSGIDKGLLNDSEKLRLAETLSAFYKGGDACLNKYKTDLNFEQLEADLNKLESNIDVGFPIVIDNSRLSVLEIDMSIQKLKAQYGDRVACVIVDYVNQLAVQDMYDWKVQIELSKALKEIARKHEVVMVTPYQIDASGEARFAKGLLDAADFAFLIKRDGTDIAFASTKTRNTPIINCVSTFDSVSLRISAMKQHEERSQDDDIPF